MGSTYLVWEWILAEANIAMDTENLDTIRIEARRHYLVIESPNIPGPSWEAQE